MKIKFIKKSNIKVIQDVSFLWIFQILAVVTSFVTQLLLTRYFDVKEYGALSTALTLTTVLGSFAALGTGQNWLRNFGKEGWIALRWVIPTIKINVFAIIISIFFCLLFIFATGTSELTKEISVIFITIIISRGLSNMAESVYQLEENYKRLAILKTLLHLFRFISAILVYFYSKSIYEVAIGYAFSSILLTLIYFLIIKRIANFQIDLKGHGDKLYTNYGNITNKSLTSTLLHMMPFSLASLSFIVYTQGNIYVVNAVLGDKSSGIFFVAFSVMNVIFLFPTTFYQSYLIPKVHRWIGGNNNKIDLLFDLGTKISIPLGIVMMTLLSFFSIYIIPFLFGKDYLLAGNLLILLSLTIPMRLLSNNMGSILVTERLILRKGIYQTVGAICSIFLTIFLASKYGLYGVVWAVVITEVLITLLFYFGVIRNVKEINLDKKRKSVKLFYLFLLIISSILITMYFKIVISIDSSILNGIVMVIVQFIIVLVLTKRIIREINKK